MRLRLYESTERAFTSNGIGVLVDAMEAEVYEELNSKYELTFKYPVAGPLLSELRSDRYVTAKPNPEDPAQPFRIYRITKPMGGLVTVYARHLVYKCRTILTTGVIGIGAQAAFDSMKEMAVNDCPFTFYTNVETEALLIRALPADLWTIMGSGEDGILATFGGEYHFNGYEVELLQRRGADRGVKIAYGKNLTALEQDENIADMYTAVYPYFWRDGEWVDLPEGYISGPGDYEEVKLLPVDMTGYFEEVPTQEQLRIMTALYIASTGFGIPEVSLTVSFVQLSHCAEYAGQAPLELITMGDTVTVSFPRLGVDASARVVATRYDPIMERYRSVSIGKVKRNVGTTVARTQIQQNTIIAKIPSLQEAVNQSCGWLTDGKGSYKMGLTEEGAWESMQLKDVSDSSFTPFLTSDGKLTSKDGSLQIDLLTGAVTLGGKVCSWTEQDGAYVLTGT